MDKKQKIIAAALEEFQANGVEKTKVSDIVKRAGVAQGTFYLYFPSKLALMPELARIMVGKTLERIEQDVTKKEDFHSKLHQLIESTFSLTKEYRGIFAIIYTGLAASDYLQQWELIYEPYYEWMTAFLEQADKQGTIRLPLPATRFAKLAIGLIESAAEQTYLYDSGSQQEACKTIADTYAFLTRALCADKPASF
ncbi:TetR family transcriptional regulator [Shouchella clausii]|uniref:TetR family transcriptional regulator n=1 Tax=Shouchella clausii TaxID=79880 RepID=A0A268S0P7_SHOCL|nr:TetR family transcriptional regulator [Shouchella clausii]PAD42988.1 TetR family transcriptional regulator [Bacillus sp. 7520-S]MBU8597671.1 TetR family transcriptional regulator [Shouchella clausii]MCY1106969.1 TetR family transcriptional regulator [Shouchella clausii]MEB5479548.1 TetR family transcriptional regulator [Shouchella clausii]MED4158077.1 TetR family transcriptional regulator [Shouchella clausii]